MFMVEPNAFERTYSVWLVPNASGVYGASLDLHPEARRRVLEAGIERSEHIKCLREQVERLFAGVRVRDVLHAQSDD